MNDLLSRLRSQFEAQYAVADNGCWLWTGSTNNYGYGTLSLFGGFALAHRLSYELFVGSIPDGLVLDHFVCDTRACVNYEHLKPVTHQENILRGSGLAAHNARKTHCPEGHPLSGDNLRVYGGRRVCHTCSVESQRLGRRRRGVPERVFGSSSAVAIRQRRYRARQKQLAETGAN